MRCGLPPAARAMVLPVVAVAQLPADGTRLPLGRDSLPIDMIRGTHTVPTGRVMDRQHRTRIEV